VILKNPRFTCILLGETSRRKSHAGFFIFFLFSWPHPFQDRPQQKAFKLRCVRPGLDVGNRFSYVVISAVSSWARYSLAARFGIAGPPLSGPQTAIVFQDPLVGHARVFH